MSMRKRWFIACGVVALGVLLATVAVLASRSGGDSSRPTLAELAAKNYRTLTKSESRTLVTYADHVYRCVTAHGAKVAAPVASSTRIVMSAPHRSARTLLGYLSACDDTVGPPPPKASLQARTGQILVYLPKQCLLSPTEVDTAA